MSMSVSDVNDLYIRLAYTPAQSIHAHSGEDENLYSVILTGYEMDFLLKLLIEWEKDGKHIYVPS